MSTPVEQEPAMLNRALELAGHGWLVFPCAPGGKRPLTEHGFLDATASEQVLRSWWTKWPDANVAVRAGAASYLLVLDVDGEQGEGSLADLEARYGKVPATLVCETPRGKHYYFAHPGGEMRNTAGKLGAGLDTRGDGGYVVSPPSTHSGKQYRWLCDPETTPLAQVPAWLLKLLIDTPGAPKQEAAASASDPKEDAEGAITEGRRNSTLASLGGTMRRRGMSHGAISVALQAENEERCQPPLEAEEVERIAGSIGRYPPAASRDTWPRTDLGNAERLVARHGADLRHVTGLGWHAWDGKRWKRDADGEAMRRTKLSARAIFGEAEHVESDEERREVVAWGFVSEHERRLHAAVVLAQTELPVLVTADELDADPWLLCVENGTVDLRTGELRAHLREDLCTKLAPVVYEAEATTSLWHRFLLDTCGGDMELAAFLQRCAGYSLTGLTNEEVLFFLHGPGGTGKSTFIETLKASLGDYARTADFDTFLRRKGDRGIPSDIARLAGARLVAGVEVEEGKALAEGLIKQLTGGDTVTARFMYRDFFEFHPTFKLWLVANARPQVNAEDAAMWRRILQVPFTMVVPEHDKDEALKARLKAPEHMAAVLAWAVQGCLEWQKVGLAVPDSVRAYTEEYRHEADAFAAWVADECVLGGWLSCEAGKLRARYEDWCKANGSVPVADRTWGKKLHALGCERDRDTSGERKRRWRGIDLAE
jgi:putative DNA primase/helicase